MAEMGPELSLDDKLTAAAAVHLKPNKQTSRYKVLGVGQYRLSAFSVIIVRGDGDNDNS